MLLAVGIALRWPATVPWAVLLTGAGYLAGREGRSLVDGWAAAVGVMLLVAAELATWSIEHDARIRSERALLVNFLLLATAAVAASAGVVLAAIGVAAAVGAVAVVLRLVAAS